MFYTDFTVQPIFKLLCKITLSIFFFVYQLPYLQKNAIHKYCLLGIYPHFLMHSSSELKWFKLLYFSQFLPILIQDSRFSS